MSKFDFIKKMDVKELNTRINTTGSEEFKKALQAELATRNDKPVEPEKAPAVESEPEAPVESVEESSEETDTNEEPVEEVVEAPKPKRTRRSKTSQEDSE